MVTEESGTTVETFEASHEPTLPPGDTIWEKLGAGAGLWVSVLLLAQLYMVSGATTDAAMPDFEYAQALLDERMLWEWTTFFGLVGGLGFVWFMGSLASRLRLAEGEPGRLANIAFGVGTLWGAVWLLSALFNSVSILFAADYANPMGSRIAGMLARETVYVLTPAIVYTLILAVTFVALRYGGFPAWYTYATTGLMVAFLGLAIVDWYGEGSLSLLLVGLSLAWTAVTSLLLIPTYRPPDYVRGAR